MSQTIDPFAFAKQLFQQSGVPGFAMPPLSEDEIDRKLNELRQVEQWLTLNLNVLKGQMQALEAQKNLVKGFAEAQAAFTQAVKPAAAAAPAAPIVPPEAMMNPAKWMEALQQHMQPFVEAAQKNMAQQATKSAPVKPAAKPAPRRKKPTGSA